MKITVQLSLLYNEVKRERGGPVQNFNSASSQVFTMKTENI
jgi:hypothetical protein